MRRSKRHTQPQLLVALLFGLLIPNGLNDGRFIQPHRGYPTTFDTAYFGAILKHV